MLRQEQGAHLEWVGIEFHRTDIAFVIGPYNSRCPLDLRAEFCISSSPAGRPVHIIPFDSSSLQQARSSIFHWATVKIATPKASALALAA